MREYLGDELRLSGLRKENARAWAEVERLRAALKQIMDIADEGVVSEAILNRIGHIADETVNIQQSSGERGNG